MFGLDDIFNIVKTGVELYSTYENTKATQEYYDVQKKELERQKRISEASAKREARIKTAKLLAAQGNSGATVSTASSGVYGIEASLQSGLSDLSAQTSAQIDQFNLAESKSKTQGTLDLFTTLGSFSVSDTGKKVGNSISDFTSGLSGTDLASQSKKGNN